MAIKTYAKHPMAVFEYTDRETGEKTNFTFSATANLFPIFLTFTGVELLKAFDDYKRDLTAVLTKEQIRAAGALAQAKTVDEQIDAVMKNADDIGKLEMNVYNAGRMEEANGMNFLECLAVCMYANAQQEPERTEILATGYTALPDEVYDNPEFLTTLLGNALSVEKEVRKSNPKGKRPM